MFGGSKQKALVGLDIGSSSIKAVELKSTKHGYELVRPVIVPMRPSVTPLGLRV